MQLYWNKCHGDVWCGLASVNLSHPHFDSMTGVYIIWHGGPTPAVVRVGQGDIRQRLTEHRENPKVQAFASLGLFVTWAKVVSWQVDGVERYLAERLKPKVGDRFPDAETVEVNLPW